MKEEATIVAEAAKIVEDAQALLAATAHIAEEKVVAARERLTAALEGGRDVLAEAKERAQAGVQAADETIREHPYQAIGLAVCVGAVVGYLLGRRN